MRNREHQKEENEEKILNENKRLQGSRKKNSIESLRKNQNNNKLWEE